MSPRIMCHHHSLSDSDREFITQKIERLKKYFERLTEVSVILDAAKHEALAELLIVGPQISFSVKDHAPDMRSAFESALHKAERTLTKIKGKKWGGKKHGRRNVTIRRIEPVIEEFERSETDVIEASGSERTEEILPTEHIEPEPMTLRDAQITMRESRNGLLVFVNIMTNEINILHTNAENHIELVELTGTVLYQPSVIEFATT